MNRDFQDDSDHGGESMDLSEDSLRQALARLGSGKNQQRNDKPRKPMMSGNQDTPVRNRPSGAGFTPSGDRGDQRRRRFVQDGQVVVEHQASRFAARPQATSQDTQDEIERLKNSVRREQRRWEESERALAEVRSTLRGFETRAVHAELHVRELEGQLRERDERALELQAQLRETRATQDQLTEELRDLRRTRRTTAVKDSPPAVSDTVVSKAKAAENDGPEPVQWWIRK